jgi:hypothetical protein
MLVIEIHPIWGKGNDYVPLFDILFEDSLLISKNLQTQIVCSMTLFSIKAARSFND